MWIVIRGLLVAGCWLLEVTSSPGWLPVEEKVSSLLVTCYWFLVED